MNQNPARLVRAFYWRKNENYRDLTRTGIWSRLLLRASAQRKLNQRKTMEAEKLPTPIKFEKWCAWNAAPCEKSSEAQIERLQEKIQELEAMLSAVGAGGVSAQRITQAKDHMAQDRKMVAVPVPAQEPFGYFKAEPFGWRDCAETDEGAVALYEAPQPPVPSRMRLVNEGALQVVINALRRDAEGGKAVRGEMADELLSTSSQPQADGRDAQRYRWLRAQPLESDMFCTTIWRKGSDEFGDDLRLEELDAVIDAAIAAAKENK